MPSADLSAAARVKSGDLVTKFPNAFIALTLSTVFLISCAAMGPYSLLGSAVVRTKPVMQSALSKAVIEIPFPPHTGQKIVVLTIDDAPSARTGELLDILNDHNATATWFVHTDYIVTENADHTSVIQRALRDGHELGHHMPHDTPSVRLSKEEFSFQFERSHDVLERFQPDGPRYFRPAGGTYNDRRMGETLARFGYDRPLAALGVQKKYVLGGFLPWDTQVTNTPDRVRNHRQGERYAEQLLAHLYPGAIVVFHDGDHKGFEMRLDATVHSLDHFLRGVAAEGYRAMSLTEAIALAAEERQDVR